MGWECWVTIYASIALKNLIYPQIIIIMETVYRLTCVHYSQPKLNAFGEEKKIDIYNKWENIVWPRVELLSFYPQNGVLSMHDDDDGFAAAQRDI